MKKTALLNSGLSARIAMMGHTDSLCVADAGLPIPAGVERIDLALSSGIPSFLDTLSVILQELKVERALIAEEARQSNSRILSGIEELMHGTPLEFVSHEQFKDRSQNCRSFVRTGECTPYANIILYSGVVF